VVSNLVNTGLMLIVSVTLVDSWLDQIDLHGDPQALRQEAEAFVDAWESAQGLRDEFRVAIGRLRAFFAEMSKWLEQMAPASVESINQNLQVPEAFAEFSKPFLTQLRKLVLEFQHAAHKIPEEQMPIHRAFVQKELHPLIMRAPFPHRTFHKPLGYAGDYEMMNMIHREVPEGPNLYARIVNLLYVRQPMARCVRNRVATLEDYLNQEVLRKAKRGEPFRVLSVGCGPALEVQRFILHNELSINSQIDLLDFNEETLGHARERIWDAMSKSGRYVAVTYIKESVHSLLKHSTTGRGSSIRAGYDFIYCAGLFDYLSDRVCSRLTRLFYQWLRPAGVVLVTNMHDNNLDRYILEFKMEWYLIYRTESQMANFLKDLGAQRLFVDDTGINLCLEVRHPGD